MCTGSGCGDGTPLNLGLKATGNRLLYAPMNPLLSSMGSVKQQLSASIGKHDFEHKSQTNPTVTLPLLLVPPGDERRCHRFIRL
jgi:hypothetical protein